MTKNILFALVLLNIWVSPLMAQFAFSVPATCYYGSSTNTVTGAITATSSGITSYSWSAMGPNCMASLVSVSPNGLNVVLQYNCCGTYTVQVSAFNGSTFVSSNTLAVNAYCPPFIPITVSNGSVSCGGSPVTLSASGASSYSWSNGQPFGTIVVSPSVTTCYTVGGTSSQGCIGFNSACVMAGPLPTVTMTTAGPVCMGQSVSLTGLGAMTYTWYPGTMSGVNVVVYPLSSTCYTLAGYDGTCTGYAVGCVSVMPTPTLVGSINNYSQCLGSSITVTVGGALSYTWNTTPPVNTNTLNVLTNSWVQVYVSGTDANGCVSTESISVWADSTCAMVWPGDANSDGVVNTTDVFELGLYASSTGASRSPGGNNYTAQFATAWTGVGSNGQNRAHIDCNGDGSVGLGDTLAISNNFSMTHSFRQSGVSSSGDITIVAPFVEPMNTGHWWKVDIMLGSATNVMNDIYGVAFDFTYDDAFVDAGQVSMVYPSGFLDAGNQNIPFRKVAPGGGLIHCVTVRTDGNTVDGHGKIAEFYSFNNTTHTGPMNFAVNNVRLIDNLGNITPASGGTATVSLLPVGVMEHSLSGNISLFPNPSASVLHLGSREAGEVQYTITDLTGRVMLHGSFELNGTADVSSLAVGHYFVTFESASGKTTRSLVIAR